MRGIGSELVEVDHTVELADVADKIVFRLAHGLSCPDENLADKLSGASAMLHAAAALAYSCSSSDHEGVAIFTEGVLE